MKRIFSLTVACLALAVACTPPSSTTLTANDITAIQERFDELSRHLSSEDTEAWSRDSTEDVEFMFEGTPMIHGREALYDFGENDSPVALAVSFSDVELHGADDLAWETRNHVATIEGVEGPVPGKQLLVLWATMVSTCQCIRPSGRAA